MTYIYDLLLNFQDKERLVEFFEWSKHDALEHVKKIPIARVSSIDMDNFCFAEIKVSKDFLDKIKGKTLLYKKKKVIPYASLFCDLNRVVAIEFSDQGKIIARSCLLLDEESEVTQGAVGFDEESITYKVIKKDNSFHFLTREEEFQKKYLLKEISFLFEKKDDDKLIYLYEEVFGKDTRDILSKYERLRDDLTYHFDFRYRRLFDIVRLSYSKK